MARIFMKRLVFSFFYMIVSTLIIAQEQKLPYFGTVYNTVITDDRVNVRSYPSLKGNILFQAHKNTEVMIIGVSQESQFIDNYNGYWVKISVKENQPNALKEGWVFGKYVDYNNNEALVPSEIKIIKMSAPILQASYTVHGREKTITVYPHKEERQNFYTFAYDVADEGFHYRNIPGSYVWYPETNELQHISYIGTSGMSAWVIFTDDLNYMIEDFGTAPPPRGLKVWRVSDDKEVFSGTYYQDIKLYKHTIEIIYVYNWWTVENKKLDSEMLNYCENFKKNNPKPPDMLQHSRNTGLPLELIIYCELNLDTGMRKIIKGQYIHTQ
jgi:hypothetical protein